MTEVTCILRLIVNIYFSDLKEEKQKELLDAS